MENQFSRTLQFAYTFGGDADTIGSMAGAIAGAKLGLEAIPKVLIDQCEAVKEAENLADELFHLVEDPSPDSKKSKTE